MREECGREKGRERVEGWKGGGDEGMKDEKEEEKYDNGGRKEGREWERV